jgi:glycosyltransferase involved in cell wall biosynthesis
MNDYKDTSLYGLTKSYGRDRTSVFTPNQAQFVTNEVHPSANRGVTIRPGDGNSHPSSLRGAGLSTRPSLQGKRVAMVTFSLFPFDPRPRRAADALYEAGMVVDLLCEGEKGAPTQEVLRGINVRRLPIEHGRGGKLRYAYEYSAFILMASAVLALRSLRRRYDLVYVHNMPDILVLSGLIPKMLGAKVILDQHDPMPELMTTIFNLDPDSLSVRLVKRLEKWSLACANLVITVNVTCKRIFATRSCPPEKIGVVMNSPNENIFPFQVTSEHQPRNPAQNKRFVIMCHGSIVERNGLDLAIAALARVRESVPEVELRIFGRRTPFLDRVMEDARTRGLGENVLYLGGKMQQELVQEIEACDVGIIPNPRNAFTEINTPTRIFEYLALGRPVICPRTSGIQDYFSEDSLMYFDPGNVDDLAKKIEYVATHTDEAVDIAKRGQQVYLAHTWAQERETLVDLVDNILDRSN